MSHVHARRFLRAGATVEVSCAYSCKALLMDDRNYALFERGQATSFYGSLEPTRQISIAAPYAEHWNIVLLIEKDHPTLLDYQIGFRDVRTKLRGEEAEVIGRR